MRHYYGSGTLVQASQEMIEGTLLAREASWPGYDGYTQYTGHNSHYL